jgi:hypothetical protein
MITEVFRSVPGDFDLDGLVDARDYIVARKLQGTNDARYTQGDADLDGDVDQQDLAAWETEFGFVRVPLLASGGSGALSEVPEPHSITIAALVVALIGLERRTRRGVATTACRRTLTCVFTSGWT